MEKYKPGYMGKVMPAPNDKSKVTDFLTNQYDAFNSIYDACKDQSDKINDLKTVESDTSDPDKLSVKVSTDMETMSKIKEAASGNESVVVNNDVITAKSTNDK